MIPWSGYLERKAVKVKIIKEGDTGRLKATKRFQCDEF